MIKIKEEYREKIEQILGYKVELLEDYDFARIKSEFKKISDELPDISLFFYKEEFNGGGERTANNDYECICCKNGELHMQEGNYYPRGDWPFEGTNEDPYFDIYKDYDISDIVDGDEDPYDYGTMFKYIINDYDLGIYVYSSPY